jgi:hypothetical protein
MTSEDTESMREALAALSRAPALKTGFGIERLTVRADLWEERLVVRGAGTSSLSTLRSFGDASGEAIGRFQSQLADARVDDILRAVNATLSGGPAASLSPGDVRVLITVVACGSKLVHVVGGGPEFLEPYAQLLAVLDQVAFEARKRPVCTLQLEAELPATTAPSASIPVVLTFVNNGGEGAWIRNPAAGMEDAPAEHVRLWYAQVQPEQPGITPLPMEPESVPLEPALRVQRPLLWLGPGESEARQFSAQLSLDPGTYLMRASFASYAGVDTVAGHNLLRGCVFSQEQTVEVRG